MASTFRGMIEFMDQLGIYDVILPFLLVFTIVFAILEKTRVLGVETMGENKQVSKKNINALVAFVVGFLVVASTQLVSTINEAMANMVLLLLLIVSFLLLVGSFHTGTSEFFLDPKKHKFFYWFFMGLMLVGILGIFLHAIKTEDGQPFLYYAWDWLSQYWDNGAVGSVIMILVLVGFMAYITNGGPKAPEKEENK